jgi:hypothetical protein
MPYLPRPNREDLVAKRNFVGGGKGLGYKRGNQASKSAKHLTVWCPVPWRGDTRRHQPGKMSRE